MTWTLDITAMLSLLSVCGSRDRGAESRKTRTYD